MDNFKIIYKILKILEQAMDYEEFDYSLISAEQLNITPERLNYLLIQMQKNGYIEGLLIYSCAPDKGVERVYHPIHPKITIKGLEYLSENSMMKKVHETLKGLKEIIPL